MNSAISTSKVALIAFFLSYISDQNGFSEEDSVDITHGSAHRNHW